ncbi:thioredoxin 2 [Mortierella sp. AD031]|nr:thioredoxin 2 [Mortierella sp. AD031]
MNSLRILARNTHNIARLNVQVAQKLEFLKANRAVVYSASDNPRTFQSSSRLLTGKVHDATDKTFSDLTNTKETVIVDFHADWCRPCKILDPVIRNAVKSSGEVTLVRVDVDECPETAAKFKVASVPTVMALKNGDAVDRFVGAVPLTVVEGFISKNK